MSYAMYSIYPETRQTELSDKLSPILEMEVWHAGGQGGVRLGGGGGRVSVQDWKLDGEVNISPLKVLTMSTKWYEKSNLSLKLYML